MFGGDFGFIICSSYREIEERIQKEDIFKDFIEETLRIINKNPFKEDTISILLNENWTCKVENYIWSSIDQDRRVINLEKRLNHEGKIYDFYERDIHLIHELNHAWFNRFKIDSFYKCLDDSFLARYEFGSRLINELLSRKNRANPWILKKAVEGFGLEPQIYDLSSKMAFENNSNSNISPLAKKNKDLLKINFIDGYDTHYYKEKFRKLLKRNPNNFWENLQNYGNTEHTRAVNFLIEEEILDSSPIGNYGFLNGKNELEPGIWVKDGFYFKSKKDALNYINYFKEKDGQDLKLVRIQKV